MKHQSDKKNETRYYTVPEIAERWLSSERHVRRVISSGTLPVHRFGRLVRVSDTDLTIYERLNREA